MAWRRPGDKPLSEPMMVALLRHIFFGLNELLGSEFWKHMSTKTQIDNGKCYTGGPGDLLLSKHCYCYIHDHDEGQLQQQGILEEKLCKWMRLFFPIGTS